MATKTVLTFAEFEQLPDDGLTHELLDGELNSMPPPNKRHGILSHRLRDSFRPFLIANRLGDAFVEMGYKIGPRTWLQPDVSVVTTGHVARSESENYFIGAPMLAVEIVSDSNTAEEIEWKIDMYLANGSDEVWVIYPKQAKVRIFSPQGDSKVPPGGELRTDALPGWSLSLDELFR